MTVADTRFVPIDRLGRPLEPVDDWHEAEEALEAIGLRFLMDRYVLAEAWRGTEPGSAAESASTAATSSTAASGRDTIVRIAHVYDDRIVLSTALTDAVEDVGREIVVPFPAPSELRALE